MNTRIAIIGAGISGLTLAHALRPYATVTVFEKSRGVSGRMSTRYADPFYFDHGTQFFTARSTEFQEFLRPLIDKNVVMPWEGHIANLSADATVSVSSPEETLYVAAPHMNSLCKHLAQDLHVITHCEIAPLQGETAPWTLYDKDNTERGTYDWVISTAPPIQTQRLLGNAFSTPNSLLGCFALMLGFSEPWNKPWIAARCSGTPISWIGINSSKPLRNNNATSIVVHASNAWSEQYMQEDQAHVQALLSENLLSLTGWNTADAHYVSLHSWRYALQANGQTASPYIDTTRKLAACGDWMVPSRIEDVWNGAHSLSQRLIPLL